MAANLVGMISKTIRDVTKCTDHPEKYLEAQTTVSNQLRKSSKVLYDLLKQTEVETLKDTLPALIIDNFDDEQVWQEIDVQNSPSLPSLVHHLSRVVAGEPGGFGTIKSSARTSGSIKPKRGKSTRAEFTDKAVEQELSDDGNESDMSELLGFGEAGGLDGDESEEDLEMIHLLDKVRSEAGAEGDDGGDEEMEDDDDEEEDDHGDDEPQVKKKSKKRTTVVDDKFFKISDLEEFLDTEDLREERRIKQQSGEITGDASSSEEDVDMFTEEDAMEDNETHYGDFFDPPANDSSHREESTEDTNVAAADDEEDEDDKDPEGDGSSSEGESIGDIMGGKEAQLSAFEKRQLKIEEKIRQLESVNISEKPWQLVGEVSSGARPENSLLSETLDYEQSNKLAPVITEETTLKLEDLIKQRIKDKAWDDVERKEKPQEDGKEYKRRLILDQEKSQMSLSQIYEQEYTKATQSKKEDVRDPQHEVIEKMMSSLFKKLDALANYHYTPKQAVPEVKIVSNLPSVAMEEVIPSSVSDAALLAPEEVQEKNKGETKGATEKTTTDRKRERREKKLRQKDKAQAREKKQKAKEKASPGATGKTNKSSAMKELSKQAKSSKGLTVLQESKSAKQPSLTSSKNFFTQLQEEVTTQIRTKTALAKKRKTDNAPASKYML